MYRRRPGSRPPRSRVGLCRRCSPMKKAAKAGRCRSSVSIRRLLRLCRRWENDAARAYQQAIEFSAKAKIAQPTTYDRHLDRLAERNIVGAINMREAADQLRQLVMNKASYLRGSEKYEKN